MNALLKEIAGRTHNGAPARIPAVFGMNFQSVYIGQSVSEPCVANTPATLLGSAIPYSKSPLNTTGIGATEDDVSVLWLNQDASVTDAVREGVRAGLGLGPRLTRGSFQRCDERTADRPPVAAALPDQRGQSSFDSLKLRDPFAYCRQLLPGDLFHFAAVETVLQR